MAVNQGPCAELRALQGKFDALQEETAELKRENEARKTEIATLRAEIEALQGMLENDTVLREAALLLFDEAARSVVPKLRNKTDGVRPFARFNHCLKCMHPAIRGTKMSQHQLACFQLCGITESEYFALHELRTCGSGWVHPRVTPEKLRRALDSLGSLGHLDDTHRSAVAKILRSAGTILH